MIRRDRRLATHRISSKQRTASLFIIISAVKWRHLVSWGGTDLGGGGEALSFYF